MKRTAVSASANHGLTREDLLRAYRTMVLSRKLDDKEIQLKNQSLIFFQISGAGHEAVLTAAGMVLKAGYDWFYPYYRDRALCLALGMTPLEMLLSAVGAKDDPNSGGRQMPSHWGHKALNIVSQSSPTGTQCLQAIGCAEASVLFEKLERIPDRNERFKKDEVTYVSIGEGTSSEGEFWESLNSACLGKLPVVYLIEDNGYAISVPVEVQTAGGDLSKLVASYPGLYVQSIDGTDFLESYRAMTSAVAYARERKGPAFVHAKVIRPYSHSLSDDEKLYKTKDERAEEAKRDPISRMAAFITGEGLATEGELEALLKDVEREVIEAADTAVKAEKPAPNTATLYVYSPDVDPGSDVFRTRRPARGETRHDGVGDQSHDEGRNGARRAHRRFRRRCRGREPGVGARIRAGQRRGLQGYPRTSARVRFDARLQLAAGGGEHHRTRGGDGHARHQTGRRDPVLRLHLAGDDAAARRDVDDAIPVEQRVRVSDGDPRRDRRIPARGGTLPQSVG